MEAMYDEDQENDPEMQGNSYAIELVLEELATMMTVRSAPIRSHSCELIGMLLVEIPQEYELTLPVNKSSLTNQTPLISGDHEYDRIARPPCQ